MCWWVSAFYSQICVEKQLHESWLSFRAKFGCTKMKELERAAHVISISFLRANRPHRMELHKYENGPEMQEFYVFISIFLHDRKNSESSLSSGLLRAVELSRERTVSTVPIAMGP
jgi:hypothetical protein